jgi:hypothetical protein
MYIIIQFSLNGVLFFEQKKSQQLVSHLTQQYV